VRSAVRRRIIGRVTTQALERVDLGEGPCEMPDVAMASRAEMAAASGRATRAAMAEALGAG
jgi:hypothetical protein